MFGDKRQMPPANVKTPLLWLFLTLVVSFEAIKIYGFAPAFYDAEQYQTLVNRDFVNYWMSGKMALAGELEHLFPREQYQMALEATFPDLVTEDRGWSYPPHFILLCVPFSVLPYPVAYAAFMAITLAFWIFASVKGVKYFVPSADSATIAMVVAFTLPFIVSQITLGQNGFLIGGAFILALVYRKDRPWVTGLMLAILTMKPHLGLLWPFLLIMEKNWRAIVWGGGFTLAILGLSVAAFGMQAWHWFLDITIVEQSAVVTAWLGPFLFMMPSWFGALRAMGIDAGIAMPIHLVFVVPLFCVIVWAMTRTSAAGRSALMAVGTYTTLPYVFNYDLGPLILVAALCFVFAVGKPPGERQLGTILLLLLVTTLQIWMPITIALRETAMEPSVLLPPLFTTGFLIYLIWSSSVRQRQDELTD